MNKNFEKMLDDRLSKLEDKMKDVLKKEIHSSMQMMMNEFKEIKTSMEFLNEKYEEVSKENKKLKEELNSIKKDQAAKTNDILALKKENDKMMIQLNDFDNMMRLSNLELHGVPAQPNENLERVVVSLLKLVDSNISLNDIETSFRLKKPGRDHNQSPILVKLKSKEMRMNLFANKRKLYNHNFLEIGIDTKKVFINENITPATKALFYNANLERKKEELAIHLDQGWNN